MGTSAMGEKELQKQEHTSLIEGTFLDNIGKKEHKGKIPIWVKESHLQYEQELKNLQIELMKLQLDMKDSGGRILAIFEGRDAAGKGGTIKSFVAHLNPRNTRVVALTKPNDTELTQWYFQRYTTHLPSAGEIVFLDRSWYNRAMVEPIMDSVPMNRTSGF
ncbi:MAG: polyphosphate kinase 2 (PPK2 family) [Desulforhopalus sp.]|jgi:polyphosphate kinase 2 (PPK2 family)